MRPAARGAPGRRSRRARTGSPARARQLHRPDQQLRRRHRPDGRGGNAGGAGRTGVSRVLEVEDLSPKPAHWRWWARGTPLPQAEIDLAGSTRCAGSRTGCGAACATSECRHRCRPGRRHGGAEPRAGAPRGAGGAAGPAAAHRRIAAAGGAPPARRHGAARVLRNGRGMRRATATAPSGAQRGRWRPTFSAASTDPDGISIARGSTVAARRGGARGAEIIAPARIEGIARRRGRWRVSLATPEGPVTRSAQPADRRRRTPAPAGAAPRRAPVRARPAGVRLDVRQRAADRSRVDLRARREHGWWYTARCRDIVACSRSTPTPTCRRRAVVRDRGALLARTRGRTPRVGGIAMQLRFRAGAETSGFTAAHTSMLTAVRGDRAGSRSATPPCALDPLSARACSTRCSPASPRPKPPSRHLAGAADALTDYDRAIADIWSAYRAQLVHWYGAEARWTDRPFWRRRLAAQ